MRGSLTQLQHLASMYGVRTSYLDTHGAEVVASAESLLAVLRALGAQIGSPKDIASAARARRREYWRRICEPVILAHDNEMLTLNLRLPARCIDSQLKAALTTETGERLELDWRAELTSVINSVSVEGAEYAVVRLYLPEMLPQGYHTLQLEIDDLTADSHIICSPQTVRRPFHAQEEIWGVFIPLYSLQTRSSWGTASFWDLERLREWTAGAGGKMVGTLPLLATFGESAGGVSPYMPASRLFWNEFYIDIERIPHFVDCREAQQLVSSSGFQKELASLRSGRRVKHEPQMALKRQVLQVLAEQYVQHENPPTGLAEYVANTPHAKDYARFRAAGEKYGTCWQEWPQAARDGQLNEGDFSPQAERYHLYAQWICH
jgi:4-alpha-glucanotransferase